jgi:hypothetical protein
MRRTVISAIAALLAGVTILVTPRTLASHEVPTRVTVFMFVKPEGQTLRVLVRAPLQAMRDLELPLRPLGYLDLARVEPATREAAQIWIADYLRIFEEGRAGRLGPPIMVATRISLPSDRAFASYATALAQLNGPPLPLTTDLPWQQAMLDVQLDYPITTATARFSIDPLLAHLGVQTATVLRFLPPDRGERIFEYTGNPGVVRLDPRWHQAVLRFVRAGIAHILDGLDHLLFVFCLVIPFRGLRSLVVLITSFTIAHSITLIAAASGLAPSALWFQPLIEMLIALSIVYMAFENIVGPKLERRWAVAFAFGLVHGFGFAFVLRETMQFAGAHVLTSLLAFNVGVELGQLLVVGIAVPLLTLVFRRLVSERIGTILLSALVAHTGWHWMTARLADLREYSFAWPVLDATFALGALRAAMLLLLVGAAAWLLSGLAARLSR